MATAAAPPAVENSVIDAPSHRGVTDVAEPATPRAVRRAIREAEEARS